MSDVSSMIMGMGIRGIYQHLVRMGGLLHSVLDQLKGLDVSIHFIIACLPASPSGRFVDQTRAGKSRPMFPEAPEYGGSMLIYDNLAHPVRNVILRDDLKLQDAVG